MKGINEADEPSKIDITFKYSIDLIWVDGDGKKHITQAMYPANLRDYLKDKLVKEVIALYFMRQLSDIKSVESLNLFCND